VKYPQEENNYGESSNLRIRKGSALVLVTICMVVLSLLGVGMLTVAYGVRHEAIQLKNESISMLAAEAGYEKAVFWMSQQKDMLEAIYNQSSGVTGSLSVTNEKSSTL
jgi:Tfp pilus assembly protein PilX